MATLKMWYDQEPDNDLSAGDPAVLVSTWEELSAFIDRVSTLATDQPCPSVIEVSIADDPYAFPIIEAGIGADRGFVRVNGADALRTTQGDPDAEGTVRYDLQGQETLIPASTEVSLTTVRAVLGAYLEHDGLIPDDFPDLHAVDAV